MTLLAHRLGLKRRHVLASVSVLAAGAWLLAGCDFSINDFFCCPVSEPIARAALPKDMTGTWRASLQHDELAPWSSGQLDPLIADTFFHFDGYGQLQYLGLITPGDTVGVWLVDFAAQQPSEAFHIVRSGIALNHASDISSIVLDQSAGGDPNDLETLGATVAYALRADQGFGVVGFELTWRIDDVRIDPTGTVLTGLLLQTEKELSSPVPAQTSYGGPIWLRKIDLTIQEPAGLIDVACTMTPRGGGQIPHAIGTIFDLDAGGTIGPSGMTYSWTVQRTTVDDAGRFVSAARIDAPDGQISSFTAGAAGTYLVRCWVTDGTQWATAPPLTTRVE